MEVRAGRTHVEPPPRATRKRVGPRDIEGEGHGWAEPWQFEDKDGRLWSREPGLLGSRRRAQSTPGQLLPGMSPHGRKWAARPEGLRCRPGPRSREGVPVPPPWASPKPEEEGFQASFLC